MRQMMRMAIGTIISPIQSVESGWRPYLGDLTAEEALGLVPWYDRPCAKYAFTCIQTCEEASGV